MQAKAVIEWLGREDTDADFISKKRAVTIIYDEDMQLIVREDVTAKFEELLEHWVGCIISKFTLQQISHAFTTMLMQYRQEGILFLRGEMLPATSYYTLLHTDDFDLYEDYFYYS
jgi:hypothetical protein